MAQNPNQVECSLLFTPGRACAGPTAVVLHEFKSGIEMLDNEMCRCLRPRPLTSPGCHTSFHYGVSGNCNFRQYVDDADTAWGFYFIPTPACPTPPCPIVQTCDGIGADQYNPDLDGNLPTPVVAAGPDLTANCSVIHVAVVTGAAQTGSGIYCIGSHNFSERAYNCLVQSLCYIYEVNGLTPVGYSTLLTHIGELMDLDLDQLAIDIQACLDAVPAPLPPCDCTPTETPISVTDTATLDLAVSGVNNHTVTGNVRLSATAGNDLTANPDGLYTPVETPLTVNDSTTVNLTASGTANHTLTAVVIVSPNDSNALFDDGDGLFVPEPAIPTAQDCAVTPIINLNGYSFITADDNGANVGYRKYADPVLTINGSGLDVVTEFANGKRIFLITNHEGEFVIGSPPDDSCANKEIWIKNISPDAVTITAAPALIDGQANLTLAGQIALTASGDGVHLAWDSVTNNWWILTKYTNA